MANWIILAVVFGAVIKISILIGVSCYYAWKRRCKEDDEESRRLTRTKEAFSKITIPLQSLPPASQTSLLSLKNSLQKTNVADRNSMQAQNIDTITLEDYYQSIKAQAAQVRRNSSPNFHGPSSKSTVNMDTK